MSLSNLPNVLFVTHRVPFPPDKGDRIRTYHLLRYLAGRSRVHLASFADEPVTPETTEHLSRLTVRFSAIPHGVSKWPGGARSFLFGHSISEGIFSRPGMRKLLGEWLADTPFQGVVLSASSLASYLKKPGFGKAVTIVDSVDVDSQKWLDYAAASAPPKKWVFAAEGKRLRRTEQRISEMADAVTFVSERETQLVREYCRQPEKIVTATNGVDLAYYSPQPHPNPRGIVFVGALDYKPNVEGICWFAKTIWPTMRHYAPTATLKIVGRRPVPAVRELGAIPGIEMIGQVPDVRPALAESAVVIAPLMIARGLQNKVLEAMAFGKPVVGSPAALAGFGHPEHLPAVPAETPDEWVHRTVTLLNDPARCWELGMAGRRYAEAYHDWQQCLAPFGRLLRLDQTGVTPGPTS
ncbi:TIGR03087 family PEP-CTERM/XrtA system glycosyltransferase [Zavarzinella formosa]|uniref:TIGR03087 family PEP-CTERM/XrtA system glycosyltransferase n=1 Tax=Zavarzinella formosa TaxID=360055 RepID=UPI0002DB5BE1|nr:TIGR03087 family PEP-CTERM/XrtA system glycosyltransferase [Zavarzinella formosa]